MKNKTSFKSALLGSVLLVLGFLVVIWSSPVVAQEPPDEVSRQAVVSTTFVYQGQLTDANGAVDDTCDFTFSLFDAANAGAQIGADVTATGTPVTNGSFSVELDFGSDAFTGDERFLEVTVDCGDGPTTLAPRQELHAVPYALGLRPGAIIQGPGAVLTGETTGTSNARGLFGRATAASGSTIGVRGEVNSVNSNAIGVYGLAIDAAATGSGVKGQNNGTTGYGVWGQGGANATGVLGQTGSTTNYGVWALNTGAGVALRAESQGSGSLIEAIASNNVRFRVANNGNVTADGTYTSPAADFAEMLPAAEGLEPGDVLAIGPDGELTRSGEAYQATVAGVYSTKPGFLGGGTGDLTGKAPLAVVGVVPVKVSAENGAIQPGDLLVASDTPGHAMRGGANPPNGTVIGKALAALEEETGVIQMLVILQ